jgi:hypothetical protein
MIRSVPLVHQRLAILAGDERMKGAALCLLTNGLPDDRPTQFVEHLHGPQSLALHTSPSLRREWSISSVTIRREALNNG